MDSVTDKFAQLQSEHERNIKRINKRQRIWWFILAIASLLAIFGGW